MITIRIEIDMAKAGQAANEFGAGVLVHSNIGNPRAHPDAVGATFVGICLAINKYMHSRGATEFDCLKKSGLKDG